MNSFVEIDEEANSTHRAAIAFAACNHSAA